LSDGEIDTALLIFFKFFAMPKGCVY